MIGLAKEGRAEAVMMMKSSGKRMSEGKFSPPTSSWTHFYTMYSEPPVFTSILWPAFLSF